MTTKKFLIVYIIIMSLAGIKAYAYEFSLKNADGNTIYYNYTNNGLELEVTYCDYTEDIYKGNIVIPEEVTYMGRTRKVTSIGKKAFSENGRGITSITIPQSVTNIGESAFAYCSKLESITLPSELKTIGESAFRGCVFSSIIIPGNVTSIGNSAFYYCSNLKSIIIPSSVNSIGYNAFENVNLEIVVSLINSPFPIAGKLLSDDFGQYRTFSQNTFNNATLYVPTGTIDKYKATEGWQDFLFIEEGTGPNGSGETQENEKCAKPTINYKNGKLTFNCDTEGAVCQYSITDDDIKSGSSNEVQLGVTYRISVYATKTGYDKSETATATLCWIDVEPKTEGMTDGMVQMAARAIMVKAEGGHIFIEGVENNTCIAVYTIDGVQSGSAVSENGIAQVNTNISRDTIAIVKIGNKSIKVVMK